MFYIFLVIVTHANHVLVGMYCGYFTYNCSLCRLAEGRSNPNLLDIGDLSRTNISGDVKQYMIGDRSEGNLAHSKSHDNLMW